MKLEPGAVRHEKQPMQHLLVATKNAHKTGEIRAILGPGWEVGDLNAHPEAPAPLAEGGARHFCWAIRRRVNGKPSSLRTCG